MHGRDSIQISPLCAETKAILDGLRLAQRTDIPYVRMIFDPLTLVSILNGKDEGVVEAYSILWDVEEMRRNF